MVGCLPFFSFFLRIFCCWNPCSGPLTQPVHNSSITGTSIINCRLYRNLSFFFLSLFLLASFLVLLLYKTPALSFFSLSQDRSLHGLAQKFENQIFTAAMNVEDYNSRINKKLSKVQKVGRVIFLWQRVMPHDPANANVRVKAET